MSSIQYHLIFKANGCGDYDVYEQHRCTEKGCIWTNEEYVGNTCIHGKETEFIEDYEKNRILNGKVVSYEVLGYNEVEK